MAKLNFREFEKLTEKTIDNSLIGGFSVSFSGNGNKEINAFANNCNGGNCTYGCGSTTNVKCNSVAGCGVTIN